MKNLYFGKPPKQQQDRVLLKIAVQKTRGSQDKRHTLAHYAISAQLYRGTIARTTYVRIQRPAHILCMLLCAVFFYFCSRLFVPGYLERLKEQLNEVKAVRVPVALSRLIAVAFFRLSLLSPFPLRHRREHSLKRLRPEIQLVLFWKRVAGTRGGFLLVATVPTSRQLMPQTRLCLGRYFNCRLKATFAPMREFFVNRVKYEGT